MKEAEKVGFSGSSSHGPRLMKIIVTSFALILLGVYCVSCRSLLFHGNESANLGLLVRSSSSNIKNIENVNNHDQVSSITNTQFTIKHIFHHGTGPVNYKRHRRLDITPGFIASARVEEEFSMEQETVDENNLDSVNRQLDWPSVHKGKNPWSIELSMKQSPVNGKVKRLKRRHEPDFLDSYLDYARSVKGNPRLINAINLEWEDEMNVPVPDVNDKDTIVSLATISSNAYVRFPQDEKEKKKSDWIDVGDWAPNEENEDIEFGWSDTGLRGHIFVSNDNKTVVIGIKGTSGAVLPGGGSDETAASDKTNDNLLFSCCCARVGYLWTTVCDCYEKTYTCNQDCLEKELLRKDRYYQAALDIYRNVSALYPSDTNIWVTGHSLGGSLASLLGRTYGLPVVAFEAPGEMLATQRLHLPQPPGLPSHMENIWHIGNTADPIYMGVCNGASSSCNAGGYALETACHTGKQCVYDVVTDKGWKVNLLNHRIHTVIDDIILAYNETPVCVPQPPCRDCFNWRYTSHDDDDDDEPRLPNPLFPTHGKSKPSSTISFSSSTCSVASSQVCRSGPSSSTTITAPVPKDPKKKCRERTWYGWCSKWGSDDDEDV